jgi:dTDP-4-dehydrorhamnose reductase
MKILLLGKNGQVGQEIEKQASSTHATLVSFGRDELDITDNRKLEKVIETEHPDVVINASALHVVPECETNSEKAYLINAIAVKRLAEICNAYNCRLVHFSTDYVFDGVKKKPYKESERPNPLQIYGISKLAGEYSVLNYCKNGIVIRGAYIYGGKNGSRAKKGNFVLTILKQAKHKTELEVASDQIVSPTYAGDLAEATLSLVKNKEAKGIFHFVNEGQCSLAEFAKEILRIKKISTKIIPAVRGGKAGDLHRPVYSVLRNTKGRKLGIILPPWKDGLKRYIAILD